MAANPIKSALPTHLRPGNGDEAEFTKRHHGKTRSHMVSRVPALSVSQFQLLAFAGKLRDPICVAHSRDGPGPMQQ